MTLSAYVVSKDAQKQQYRTKYVTQRKLSRQLYDGELLWIDEK